MKIVVFRSPVNLQWYFRMLARNGKTVAQSEGYKKRESALKTASLLSYRGAPISIKEIP